MKKFLAIMLVVAVMVVLAAPAFARDRDHYWGHHRHGHSHSGVSFSIGGGYYGDPYYYPRHSYYSSYYPYYNSYVVPPPVVYTPPVIYSSPSTVIYSNAPANQTSSTYIDDIGRTCREFQSTAQIGGTLQDTYGTACLQPDGSWRVVR
jgi:hypothetical protein